MQTFPIRWTRLRRLQDRTEKIWSSIFVEIARNRPIFHQNEPKQEERGDVCPCLRERARDTYRATRCRIWNRWYERVPEIGVGEVREPFLRVVSKVCLADWFQRARATLEIEQIWKIQFTLKIVTRWSQTMRDDSQTQTWVAAAVAKLIQLAEICYLTNIGTTAKSIFQVETQCNTWRVMVRLDKLFTKTFPLLSPWAGDLNSLLLRGPLKSKQVSLTIPLKSL